MSVSSMAALAVRGAEQYQILGPRSGPHTAGQPAALAPDRPAGPVPAALAAIATYIPTESIALYVLGVATIQPASAGEKWLLVLLALAIHLLYLWLQLTAHSRDQQVLPGKSQDRWIQSGLLAIVTTVALCVYIATIPGNAFAESGLSTRWAALLALVVAAALPPIAERLKLAPRTDIPQGALDVPTVPSVRPPDPQLRSPATP
jgi:hypothetical protein